MPISEKQLNANRENARKSTGPKTQSGKQRSALNGSRHNLTGAAFVMTDHDRAAFEAFCQPFIAAFHPANPVEQSFAHLIAIAHWRLNRIHAIEENTLSLGHFSRASDIDTDHPEVHNALTHARVFEFKASTFNNLSLYEQRIAREMQKNLKTLLDLQDRRKAAEREAAEREAADKSAAEKAPEPKVKTATASTTSNETGFAFSNPHTPLPTHPIRSRDPHLDPHHQTATPDHAAASTL